MATQQQPTYAILGATGNVGSSLISVLTSPNPGTPNNKQPNLNILVRSERKLLSQHPSLSSNPTTRIYTLPSSNLATSASLATLTDALKDATVAFLCIAVNENIPGVSIAQDTAAAVLTCLRDIRSSYPEAKLPRLIVLSSSSVSEKLNASVPWVGRQIIHIAASYVYEDLTKAELLLRAESGWVETAFVKPGGLVHDERKGHALSTERQQTFLSFLDLAAGMVEIAGLERTKWDGVDVAVLPTASDVKIEWGVIYFVVKGTLCHFFPWGYALLWSKL
ncbi:hypothetical protein K431DRAFT_235581 [Polychaeton citri CBS 116435]|uniref:NAD(P)-binding domain-containing protein n=1 Tax=Polychaeton citri CBS 116435 TaxID=1314669 RepID=A0A9P4UI07_9PEZI|nr:hypothetical protein K431DRAFT_235581 [Polychaeton citri CBS 116435]